jgi:zinc protease
MMPTGTLLLLALLAGGTPTAAPAVPAPADTFTTGYDVAGVRVIHRRATANEIVAVNLYLLGGSAQFGTVPAGTETMLLRVSEYGTAAYPGRETRLALARTGSRIVLDPTPDWTMFGFRGLRTEFDATWSVFAERLMHPALETAAVDVVRARMVRWARNQVGHPDWLVRRLADSIAFAGHAYMHDPDGTEESLAAITAEDLRAYLEEHMVRSRMLLVVVGDIDRAAIEAAVQRTLAQLPAGDYTWKLPPAWGAQRARFAVEERRLPTNYITGWYGGPPSNSRDYHAFRVATGILGGFAFSEIRENGLSYAAHAPFLDRGATGGGIYVTTTRPDTTIRIFNNNIAWLRENIVSRAVLQRYLKGFITEYHSRNETNAEQAEFLARHELLRGDWRLAGRYMEELRSIQGIDVRRVARQYMKHIQYAYLGDSALAPTRELTKY